MNSLWNSLLKRCLQILHKILGIYITKHQSNQLQNRLIWIKIYCEISALIEETFNPSFDESMIMCTLINSHAKTIPKLTMIWMDSLASCLRYLSKV